MNPEDRVRALFGDSIDALQRAVEILAVPIAEAARRITATLRSGGKVLACGNGGSAADAQHFSSEMLNRFERERAPLPALALTTDTSTLTSIANDYAFDQIFAKQVRALGRRGDILLLLSTSGNSPNILEAARAGTERGMSRIVLSGRDGGALAAELGPEDIELRVPAQSTARIQEVHGLIIHCLCDLVDQALVRDPNFPEEMQ